KPVIGISDPEPLYQQKVGKANLHETEVKTASNDEKNDMAKGEVVSNVQPGVTDSSVKKDLASDPAVAANNQSDSTSIFVMTEPAPQQAVPDNKKDSSPSVAKSRGKLSLGITAYFGRSNTVENLINVGGDNNMQSANFINDSLAPAAGHLEKPFKKSYSYHAGVFVQKNIS